MLAARRIPDEESCLTDEMGAYLEARRGRGCLEQSLMAFLGPRDGRAGVFEAEDKRRGGPGPRC